MSAGWDRGTSRGPHGRRVELSGDTLRERVAFGNTAGAAVLLGEPGTLGESVKVAAKQEQAV